MFYPLVQGPRKPGDFFIKFLERDLPKLKEHITEQRMLESKTMPQYQPNNLFFPWVKQFHNHSWRKQDSNPDHRTSGRSLLRYFQCSKQEETSFISTFPRAILTDLTLHCSFSITLEQESRHSNEGSNIFLHKRTLDTRYCVISSELSPSCCVRQIPLLKMTGLNLIN